MTDFKKLKELFEIFEHLHNFGQIEVIEELIHEDEEKTKNFHAFQDKIVAEIWELLKQGIEKKEVN